MKKILFFILFLLFFFQIARSAEIEVNIPRNIEGNVSSFSYSYSLNILNFQIEFYNKGSIAYKTRIRLDIFNGSQWFFTGWSGEKSLMPGDRKNFEIYWYTNSTGNFTTKVRAYLANEIFEQKFSIEKKTSFLPKSVFEVKNFRTYDDYIIFDVRTEENVKDVVVIPADFPLGWMFEQKKVDSINNNAEKTIVLHYQPTVWVPENLKLEIASDEGKYYTEKTFELRKEMGILRLFHYIIDSIKMILT